MMKMTTSKWIVLGLSSLALSLGTAACGDDEDDGGGGTGGDAGSGGSGDPDSGAGGSSGGSAGSGDGGSGGEPVDVTKLSGDIVTGSCLAADAGSTAELCGQLATCTTDACKTTIDECQAVEECGNIMNCAFVSGCVDLATCSAAIGTYPDECGALATWLGAGQTLSEANATCLTEQSAICSGAGMDAGAMDSGAMDSGAMDGGDGG